MKYEALSIEIISLANEDVLTLSGGNIESPGKVISWDSLGFTDPGTGNSLN